MITRVAANRMRLVWTEGAILNIVTHAERRCAVALACSATYLPGVMLAGSDARPSEYEWAESWHP